MKRLYAAVPLTFEDSLLKILGRLGTVQLVSDYTIKGFKKVDNVEKSEKYVKLQQRMGSVLSSLPPEEKIKKSYLTRFKSSFLKTSMEIPSDIPALENIEAYVADYESRLDKELHSLESLQGDLDGLKNLADKLAILKKHNIRIDQLGDFKHIFVKAGLIQRELTPRLNRYAEGTSVNFTSFPETRKEDFVVITGLNDDKSHIESALPLLNFNEMAFPDDINPVPEEALRDIIANIKEKKNEVQIIEDSIREIGKKFREESKKYGPVVRGTLNLEEARSNLSRTSRMSLAHGWVPEENAEEVTNALIDATSGAAYVKIEDPSTNDTPPVKMQNKGLRQSFELLTRLRGTPDYKEVDPTTIMTVLFSVMFGFMFGDVGSGLVFVIIGLMLRNLQRELLKISAKAVNKLGTIILACGISSIIFGVLYGEFFLLPGMIPPLLFSPFHNQTAIIVVALIFGVIQIGLGLILKIVNTIRAGDRHKTIFSIMVLAYYIVGVLLAVEYARTLSLSAFAENWILTTMAMSLLGLIFLFPLIEGLISGKVNIIAQLLKGFSEFIETFLSLLTNSISYVRLAAFAIAHGALGLSALILASVIGVIPSYILMNVLVILIEGLAILIQSMRLTYYEFFTKFYSGSGTPYKPFSLPPSFT
ncbi:V-type ATP synthase subunit I [[Eubacterium] cellulosolvens]